MVVCVGVGVGPACVAFHVTAVSNGKGVANEEGGGGKTYFVH